MGRCGVSCRWYYCINLYHITLHRIRGGSEVQLVAAVWLFSIPALSNSRGQHNTAVSLVAEGPQVIVIQGRAAVLNTIYIFIFLSRYVIRRPVRIGGYRAYGY